MTAKSFDEIWNSFGSNWQRMTDHSSIVSQGISEYEQKLQGEVEDRFKRFIGLTQRVVNVPGREGEIVTQENAEELSKEWTMHRLSTMSPTQDALTLVLAHAVFEALLIDLAVSAVLGVSDEFILSNYPGRKVSVEETRASSIEDVVREKLASDCYKKFDQIEVINLFVAVCQESNSTECQRIHDTYRPSRVAIEAIDKYRQDILHKVEWDPTYSATEDLQLMEFTARCYGHLYANCIEGMDIGLLLVQASSGGPLRTEFLGDER